MNSESNTTAPLWVLLGSKHGDNQQLLAIAEALNVPFRAIPLRFNRTHLLPPVLLGTGTCSWRSDVPLTPPWPQAVLAAGRRSVPAARWIRRQSAGRTRLIHIGRPWSPLSWFDLIVTTPQYGLPQRPNVLANLLPFVPLQSGASTPAPLPAEAAALPRPWTVVLVGGKIRPYVLDEALADLARTVNDRVRETGGSAFVLDSPRTPKSALATIEAALEVPSRVVRWHQGERLFGALLRLGDRFIVTADSVAMLTEVLLTGRPVALFDLPKRPDPIWRLVSAWRAAAERAPASVLARCLATAVDLGFVTSVRDLGRLHRALEAAGVFGASGRPLELAESERRTTLARISRLIESR